VARDAPPARRAARGVALALFLAAPLAHACGVCLEDKMAATYDAGVIARAGERGHAVAFVALSGAGLPLAAGPARELRRRLEGVAGVDPGSVRVSAEHAAASFAFDPVRRTLGGLLREAAPRLAVLRLSADSLRVLVGPRARSAVSRAASPARSVASLGHQVRSRRAR
jgi:hypothetical protein